MSHTFPIKYTPYRFFLARVHTVLSPIWFESSDLLSTPTWIPNCVCTDSSHVQAHLTPVAMPTTLHILGHFHCIKSCHEKKKTWDFLDTGVMPSPVLFEYIMDVNITRNSADVQERRNFEDATRLMNISNSLLMLMIKISLKSTCFFKLWL